MNKKQELVRELTKRLSTLDIVDDTSSEMGETRLYADKNFWETYPEGHCNSMLYPSVEGLLSCLTEDSLQAILDSNGTTPCSTFKDLWTYWGRAGFLKCEPSVMENYFSHVPILRMRHDCYLHWFRDGFQNSYDSYGNGSNGASAMDFHKTKKAITLPECSGYRDEDDFTTDFDAEWNKKWALFRKAMVLSYPFQACAGKGVFYQMLDNHSEVFDDFLSKTDDQMLQLGLDKSLTVEEMRLRTSGEDLPCPTELEVPLVSLVNKARDMEIYGILRFGQTAVSFTWSEQLQPLSQCIEFPSWELEAWEGEIGGTGEPDMLDMQEYLLTCWTNLANYLLVQAGVVFTPYYSGPQKSRKFDQIPLMWWTTDDCATGSEQLYTKCKRYISKFPDRKQLAQMIRSKHRKV